MASVDTDNEVQAIQGVISALSLVDSDEARGRVLEYASKRFGLRASLSSSNLPEPSGSGSEGSEGEGSLGKVPNHRIHDIRALTEQKKPGSANEMAALVAYYLSELAPERKETIDAADIKKYFLQAVFPLPKVPKQTLLNARAAGYFDAVGEGQFRLNPVGYNLVVHNLSTDAAATTGKSNDRRAARKSKPRSLHSRKSSQARAPRRRAA